MDRIQQPHVNPVARDGAGLQQNAAFDPHAGSPQYVQDTQQMHTPHLLDRNVLGDGKTMPTSASVPRVAGPALHPTANNHAMAVNQLFQAYGTARQNINNAAWDGSPLQNQSFAQAPVAPWMQQQSQSMAAWMPPQQQSQPQQYSQSQQYRQPHQYDQPHQLNHSAATLSSQSCGVEVADAQPPKAVKGRVKSAQPAAKKPKTTGVTVVGADSDDEAAKDRSENWNTVLCVWVSIRTALLVAVKH